MMLFDDKIMKGVQQLNWLSMGRGVPVAPHANVKGACKGLEFGEGMYMTM